MHDGPVALAALGRKALHRDAAPLQGIDRQPPARRRPVPLDGAVVGSEGLGRGDAPAVRRLLRGHTVAAQGVQRHVHIGPGHQRRGQHQLRRRVQQRQRHQKAADGLGGLIPPQGIPPRRQRRGGAIAPLRPLHRIGRGQGPLQQPGAACKGRVPPPQRHGQRQQKPQRGTGIAAVNQRCAALQRPQPRQRMLHIVAGQALRQRLSRQKAADQRPVPRAFAGRRGDRTRQAGGIQPPGHCTASSRAARGTSSTQASPAERSNTA